jgi:hypothetical protein
MSGIQKAGDPERRDRQSGKRPEPEAHEPLAQKNLAFLFRFFTPSKDDGVQNDILLVFFITQQTGGGFNLDNTSRDFLLLFPARARKHSPNPDFPLLKKYRVYGIALLPEEG